MHKDTQSLLYVVTLSFLGMVFFGLLAGMQPSAEGLAGAELEHYFHTTGILKAIFTFLSVAGLVATIVSCALALLIIFKWEKTRSTTLEK